MPRLLPHHRFRSTHRTCAGTVVRSIRVTQAIVAEPLSPFTIKRLTSLRLRGGRRVFVLGIALEHQ